MGSPRRRQARAPVFGDTTDYVLKHAPCRVMVVGARAPRDACTAATAIAVRHRHRCVCSASRFVGDRLSALSRSVSARASSRRGGRSCAASRRIARELASSPTGARARLPTFCAKSVARKLPRLQRRLGAADLFGVAYGEIASSIYFALGIIAARALGLTPYVLLATGLLFLVVALSYAEGTTELRETGGAATFVRRAFNDLAGFVTGWALFLDYLIVTALAALFLPHYLGHAIGVTSLDSRPWDTIVAVAVVLAHRRRRDSCAGSGCTPPGWASPRSTSSRSSCSSCSASRSSGRPRR